MVFNPIPAPTLDDYRRHLVSADCTRAVKGGDRLLRLLKVKDGVRCHPLGGQFPLAGFAFVLFGACPPDVPSFRGVLQVCAAARAVASANLWVSYCFVFGR